MHFKTNDLGVFFSHRNVHIFNELPHFLDLFIHSIRSHFEHFDLSILLSRWTPIQLATSSWLLRVLIVYLSCKLRVHSLVEVALEKRKYLIFYHRVIVWILVNNLRQILLLRVMRMTAYCFGSGHLIIVPLIVVRLLGWVASLRVFN